MNETADNKTPSPTNNQKRRNTKDAFQITSSKDTEHVRDWSKRLSAHKPMTQQHIELQKFKTSIKDNVRSEYLQKHMIKKVARVYI